MASAMAELRWARIAGGSTAIYLLYCDALLHWPLAAFSSPVPLEYPASGTLRQDVALPVAGALFALPLSEQV